MSNDKSIFSEPLVAGLVGGIVGGALAHDGANRESAEIREKLDQLTGIEKERLRLQADQLGFAKTELHRAETERAYQHAVLWLSHCNNDERLDYLIGQNQPALAQQLAIHLIAEAELDATAATLLADHRETRHQLAEREHQHQAWQRQFIRLKSARWTGGRIFFRGLLLGCIPGIPALIALGATILPVLFLLVILFALLSPVIVRWQPIPSSFFPNGKPPLPAKNFSALLTREELLGTQRAEEMKLLTEKSASQQSELRRQFQRRQSLWLAAAPRHTWTLRPLLEAAQRAYPPRVRCDLAAITDEAIATRLREPVVPAFAAQCEHLLRI